MNQEAFHQKQQPGRTPGSEPRLSEDNSLAGSYTNLSVSQARSTLMDYPEDDTLYEFMRDELDSITQGARRQVNEFFSLSISKLKEKEHTLIKYYENKLLMVIYSIL